MGESWVEPETKIVGIEDRTLVFDRPRQRQVMWINGQVSVPPGTEIELLNPNVSARVLNVRILAGYTQVTLCLDCEVPAEYWGERE